MTRRLFVCHANADIEATSELVDALENALNFSEGALSTSGLPGYSADATDMPALGATLAASDVVLALVTTNSVRDAHVHFQLGAAWALGAHTVLFVLDPTAQAELPYALHHAPCVQASEPAEWSALIGDLSVRLGLVPRPGASVAPALSPSFVLPAPVPPEITPAAPVAKFTDTAGQTKPKIPPLPAALDDAAPELDVTAVARAMATARAGLPKLERSRSATPQHVFGAEPVIAPEPPRRAPQPDPEAEAFATLDAAASLDAEAAAALAAVETEPARITVTALDAHTVLSAVAAPDLGPESDAAEAVVISDSILPEPEPELEAESESEPSEPTQPHARHLPPPLPAADSALPDDEEQHPADRRPPRHSYIDELRAIDLADEQAAAAYALEQLEEVEEPETGEQPRIPARTPEPTVEQSAEELASDSDVFARLPSCEMALEAGRAVSDCVFNRDEINDFASELNGPLGHLIECLGASWDELRSEQDLDTWVAVTDHLLQTLPNEVRKVEEWYRVGFELATLHNLAGQLVLDGSDAAAEQHWRGALERFLMRAERAGIGYEDLGSVLGLLENLVGPSNERDLSNIPRSLEELRRYAAGADIHTAA